ncbi:hypothetical protein BE11_38365 [Sorangium cellulosum]|nr:hypothetical protein BE11_38365 [Sorangium cellulosum]
MALRGRCRRPRTTFACADWPHQALIQRRIGAVFVAVIDSDPRNLGRGVAMPAPPASPSRSGRSPTRRRRSSAGT